MARQSYGRPAYSASNETATTPEAIPVANEEGNMGQEQTKTPNMIPEQAEAPKPAPAPSPLRYIAVRGCNYVTNAGLNKHAERGQEMRDIKPSDAKELCELHAALACEPRVIEALQTLSGLPSEDVAIVKAALNLL